MTTTDFTGILIAAVTGIIVMFFCNPGGDHHLDGEEEAE